MVGLLVSIYALEVSLTFALIGRTFLEDFTMRYEGKTGMVTLSAE